jgi:hypothetical protein
MLEDCLFQENCALLGYYAASTANFLPTFQYNLAVPSSGSEDLDWRCLTFEGGLGWLSRNVGKKLPLLAA